MKLLKTLGRLVPAEAKRLIKTSWPYARHRSHYDNVFHCCVHKTGSQWLKAILSDPRTVRHSALTHHIYQADMPGRYDARKITNRSFSEPFPRRTIVSPLYIDFDNFRKMPKPADYRAFFVMRDPRDIVVSWYNSVRFSHPVRGDVGRIRGELNAMSAGEGLIYSIGFLSDFGLFDAMRSWIGAPTKDSNVDVLRFEEMIAPENKNAIMDMLVRCDIIMPEPILTQVLQDHSFERMSGRKRGDEDVSAHYRKGTPGDWKGRFSPDMTKEFKKLTGDLVVRLGYESRDDWDEG